MPIWGNCSFPELWSSVLLVAASGCWNIWFLLCGTEFQQHYIWKILGDDCPTEDTGPCGLASCILMFQACILHQEWLRCPGRVVVPQVLVLLMWTEYCCPLSWCGSGTLPCGPSSRWQRCHQQTSSTVKGGLVMTVMLSFQNSPWRDLPQLGWWESPWQLLPPTHRICLYRLSMCSWGKTPASP